MRRIFIILSIITFIIPFLCTTVMAANSSIEGYVKDAKTGEPLFGANVVLVGTSAGGATGMDGKYIISPVLPGSYSIRVSYIGYKEFKAEIKVEAGAHITKDFMLEPVGLEGQTVIVTGQASGQKQAINQQLSTDQIVNVVSAAKIQELPDANAAESVGRLPGISVMRSGGEGNQVVVRGLAPQYNQITINGIEMGSSDPSTRSTDLSMISSSMLEGIEVSKTVTADMDANVIGGIVNFNMREAQTKEPGVPQFSLDIQGGYNSLSDAYNKFNNYKYVGSFENRFLDGKLGVFAQFDIERKNLTSNELGTGFNHFSNSQTQYLITSVELSDIPRDRLRYNGALNLDYTYSTGKIKLVNFFSTGTTNSQQRSESYDISNNMLYYGLTNSKNVINSISNSVDFNQDFDNFNLDVKLAHTYSENKSPDGWDVEFSQTSGGLNQFIAAQNSSPQSVTNAANRNLAQTYLMSLDNTTSFSKARTFSSSFDLKTNLNISSDISAILKFGGMYKYQTRSYQYDEYDTPQMLNSSGAVVVDNLINSNFSLPMNSTKISLTNFLDPSFSYGKFLDGDYSMVAPLNYGKMANLVQLLKNNAALIASLNNEGTYGHNNYKSTISDYDGHENHGALYLMATVKVGPEITIIPGVRLQSLQTCYTGVAGVTSPESYQSYNHYDTTITRTHNYWLPDVTIKYKPLSWFDVRLSYSNTLSYPSFSDFVPRVDLSGTTLNWNNYDLVPAQSRNYDAYLSFYNNTIGLFTAGAFLKQIKDMVYSWSFYIKGGDVLQYLPNNAGYNSTSTYNISTMKNNPYLNKVYGVELDWQTHFWYLPGVLSGLVFDANYTHTVSKAQYPYLYTVSTGRVLSYIDTSFSDRLVDQPDDIINLSLGFDYSGFSIRVAMIYQDNIFTSASQWPQLRGYTAAYRRWDISAKQILPWFGIEVYTDLNNINGSNDVKIIQGGSPSAIEDYGFKSDLGLRIKI
ncbi:MAG: TonB-dependent receptor [Ignavibacteriaceae bacterium]|nr:TonB-dependent receptor [Ignavibacteriaceae bacterium]